MNTSGLSSFSALANTSSGAKEGEGGFAFGKKSDSSTFSFAGAGAGLFKSSPAKAADSADANNEDATDDGHDPHFEPIIPLPELVEVTTGEEDEEAIFKFRGKVFRWVKITTLLNFQS